MELACFARSSSRRDPWKWSVFRRLPHSCHAIVIFSGVSRVSRTLKKDLGQHLRGGRGLGKTSCVSGATLKIGVFVSPLLHIDW
ncbi:hypothetical protein PUN28_001187 [Cardiocondyla obscurior]|uniref:Uncharacterized protein n=1 Tax=Cardiocondyla obscurior TaxID=286306 RepID=A0AAW2H3Q2_9HYME